MKIGLVVTTIQAPNTVMRELAAAAKGAGAGFFVLGDRKSPPGYALDGASYFDLDSQHRHFGAFSEQLPAGHYVRKNLGYLAALDAGCEWIVETDDDNHPLTTFLAPPPSSLQVRRLRSSHRWANVYRHFGPTLPVWPRGLPLESLAADELASLEWSDASEPAVLVQGLADENPDVDAVYRLTRPLPVRFARDAPPLALEPGTWCPFNSQNTWFRRDIAVLAYLPAFCSFRMTDIWRSFVAQRCLWALGRRVIFVPATVWQERNEHNLLKDFADEVPGYLHNDRISRILDDCRLEGDPAADLLRCYEALIAGSVVPEQELALVRAWVDEVQRRR